MPATLIAEPLFNSPFLKLKERTMPGEPGTPLKLYPKLAATPKKLKAARSLTKLAMHTDIRIEELPAIGNPTENVPTDGIRVIHWNDRWILFGNTGTNPPRLYERTGPVYTRTNAYPNADWPTNTSFLHAAFSKAGRFMYAVKQNDTQNVQVYQWSGGDENDPEGQWELVDPLAIGAAVLGLEISPLNNFLIVKTGLGFKLFDIQNLNAPVAPPSLPAGLFLAVRSDELEWIVADTGGDVDVYNLDLGSRVFTLAYALPGSAGTDRKAHYSPDETVLALNGRATSGTGMPKFYARQGGNWVLITTGNHATATTWDVSDIKFKADGSQAFYTHTDGGAKAEFLERISVVPDVLVAGPAAPFTAGAALTGGAPKPVRDAAGHRIAVANATYSYDPVTGSFIATTPAGWSTNNASYDISRDGLWLIKQGANAITLFNWNGSAWASATAPTVPAGTCRGVSISRDGQFCALTFNQTGTNAGMCRIYQRNVGTGAWTQVGADIAMSNTDATNLVQHAPLWHPTRDDILVFNGYGGIGSGVAPKFVRLISGTWTIAPSPFPYQSGYNQMWGKATWTGNGAFLLMITRNNVGSGFLLHVFEFDSVANTFSLFQTVAPSPAMSGTPVHLQLSPDEKLVAVVWQNNTAIQWLRLFHNEGDADNPDWVSYAIPSDTGAAASSSAVVWTEGTLTFFQNTGSYLNHWLYSQFVEYPSYSPLYTFTGPGTALQPADGYNDTDSIANFGGSNWASHPFTESFSPSPTYPASLGFAPQYAITDLWGYQLSASERIVLYQTANGIGIATRPNSASAYLNTETLRAAFVELYDRTGDTFNLRSYSIHLIDSIIKDFQFSPNEEVLAYHVIAPDGAPGDTVQGRLIYDISFDKFEFRGNVWEAEMTNSLMAFSPFSTEFVVTHEHLDTNDPVITLHEFGVNYVFDTQDTKPVSFGPPDFSACNDVVVAHGGSPPMSFFIHDDPGNVLTPNPVTIDWDYVGVILAVAFRDDCEGIVVVTPDTVTTIEEGEDEWEKDEEEELDEPIEPPTLPEHEWPDVDWIDEDEIIIEPDPLTNPGYPGTYDPNTLTNISYVPYSVVSVTFRVASVAQ